MLLSGVSLGVVLRLCILRTCKVCHTRLERRQAAHLPSQGREPVEPVGGNTTIIGDA